MRTRLQLTVMLTLGLWLAFIPAANAYIDAGSTSMIFSAIIAFFAAAGVTIKMYWSRIVGAFRRGDAETAEAAEPDHERA
jgi:hypothetical protein